MLSQFKIRFRSFIWLLIFTFTLHSTPHFEILLPYKFHISFSEAKADEGDGEGAPVTGISSPDSFIFTGAASHRIPIEVPPGRGGMAPQISLIYISHQGNGWVGVGWNLDIGAIQRATKRGVNYGANDYVAVINGSNSELISRSSDWGPNYYGSKIEGTYSKYYLNPATGGWELTTKEGTKYYYGTSSASRQDNPQGVFRWCLDRVQDTKGNYLNCSYTKDQGEIYLNRIDYTGNNIGLSPANYVQFYLESRSDVTPIFTTNTRVATAYRLKTIDVVANGSRVWSFKLAYASSGSTFRSLLSSVQQYGTDATLDANGTVSGGTALPAITLGWNGDSPGTFTPQPWWEFCDPAHLRTGDYNGDGKLDLGCHANDGRHILAFSNGDGTFTAQSWWGPFCNPANLRTGDYNGDGKLDLGCHANDGRHILAFSNGDGTFTPQSWWGPFCNPANLRTGDYNGDGKLDLGCQANDGRHILAFSNGDGTFTPQSWRGPFCNPGNLTTGDYNGDGKLDLSCHTGDGWNIMAFSDGGPVFVLTSINNGMGGTITVNYKSSSAYTNTLMPFILQTVSSILKNDGRGNVLTTNYTYAGGRYDYGDRDFRGFGYVAAYQMRDSQYYESKTETWFNQDSVLKGTIQTQVLTSCEGHTKRVDNLWQPVPTPGGGNFTSLNQTTSTITDTVPNVGTFSYSHNTTYLYDQYLNVKEEHKYGATSEEQIHTYFSYTNILDKWILSKPTDIMVRDSNGNIVSRKWLDYDSNTGNILAEEVCKSDTPGTGCVSRNATNPANGYEYYPEGNLKRITDPRNYATTLNYDSTKSYVYETINYLGHKTTTEYDLRTGKLKKLIPPHPQGTSYSINYTYDVFGRKIREDRPDGGWTSYTYVNLGIPASQYVERIEHIIGGSSPLDHITNTYFDGLGRTYWVASTGPDGKSIITETQFDQMGRVLRKSNPYFVGIDSRVFTTLTYDGLSRVIDTLTPDGYHIKASYQGLKKVISDQNNHSTAYTYDVYQRLKRVEDANGTAAQYSYDSLGNLIQVVAAMGNLEQNITNMTYDSLSKKRTMTDPDMGYWTYAYDKSGNLSSQTDAKGQAITFQYDGLNRVTQKIYPTYAVTNTYDDPSVPYSVGKLTRVSDPSGGEVKEDLVIEYDLMQRVKRSQKNIGANSLVMEKAYDSAGRVVTLKYFPGAPSEKVYSYAYDVGGNTLYLRDNVAGWNLLEYSNFTALGQPGTATFPKPNNFSVKTTYTYEPDTTRLHTLLTKKMSGGTPVATYQDLTYGYDHKINITSIQDQVNGITHGYYYDALDRLHTATGAENNPYSQSYEYDRIGNITSKSDVGVYTYNYSNKPHAVRAAGNITFQYDENGNMVQRSVAGGITLDMTYNSNNKPTLVKKNSADYIAFTYDGNGQRVRKQNLSNGQVTLYFGEAYEEKGGVGIFHLFAGGRRVASFRTDGKDQFYHPNHLGSASVVTDGNGDMKERIEYYPFGTYRGRPDFDPQFPAVNYTFTDQEDDDELGLYNYKSRLYDPVLGRFLSPDSRVPDPGNPQALNRYIYCLNSPLIYEDPSGHFGILAGIFVAAWIGAAVGGITSALFGGDVGKGMITGAISGATFYGAGTIIEAGSLAGSAFTPIQQTGIHAAAGATSGGINSSITGNNIGMGMVVGGISAGVGNFAGGYLPKNIGYQLVGRTIIGGITGGIAAEIYGADFGEGFKIGAITAAAAVLFNHGLHRSVIDYGGSKPMMVPSRDYYRPDPLSVSLGDIVDTMYEGVMEGIKEVVKEYPDRFFRGPFPGGVNLEKIMEYLTKPAEAHPVP